jgi:hypothetical protein
VIAQIEMKLRIAVHPARTEELRFQGGSGEASSLLRLQELIYEQL